MKPLLLPFLAAATFVGCCNQAQSETSQRIDYAAQQTHLLLSQTLEKGQLPRTINPDGETRWVRLEGFDWTEGFFPGTLWYLYEATGDESLKEGAIKAQALIADDTKASSHDLGFAFNCSFGNGFRLTGETKMQEVMIESARSLAKRFNPITGVILSWNPTAKGLVQRQGWKNPVIIDNMMNLELLFEVANFTGDDSFRQVAITHANTTMENHYRDDYSSYHVIDYDPQTGEVLRRQTAQGYADESSWSRGQAWGLYGYVLCYRYTKDKKYLDMAENIAAYIMNLETMPEDKIPYWDYDAPNIPDEPRDVSAAAVTASALLELDEYVPNKYLDYAIGIVDILSTDTYRAQKGNNNNFILMHSVGSIPHNTEIDVPLSYADYYYVEALVRLQKRGL